MCVYLCSINRTGEMLLKYVTIFCDFFVKTTSQIAHKIKTQNKISLEIQ